MYGIEIKTNARHAKQIAAIISPNRDFIGVDRGRFFMECTDEVQARTDATYIVGSRLLSADRVRVIDNHDEN